MILLRWCCYSSSLEIWYFEVYTSLCIPHFTEVFSSLIVFTWVYLSVVVVLLKLVIWVLVWYWLSSSLEYYVADQKDIGLVKGNFKWRLDEIVVEQVLKGNCLDSSLKYHLILRILSVILVLEYFFSYIFVYFLLFSSILLRSMTSSNIEL